jgi:hypothetical protein
MADSTVVTVAEYNAAHILLDTPQDAGFSTGNIQAAINGATDWLESQLYQPVQQTSHTDIYNVQQSDWCSVDTGGNLNIYLKYFPVISLDNLYWRITPSDNWTHEFATDDYSYADDLRVIQVPFANPFWPTSSVYQQVKVVYSSGYLQAAMPNDIKQSVITLTAALLSRGYTTIDGAGQVHRLLSQADWRMVNDTIDKYTRRF